MGNNVAGAINQTLRLQDILKSLQEVSSGELTSVSFSIAFVLLAFGTMKSFSQPDINRFFATLFRAISIVFLITQWTTVKDLLNGATGALNNVKVTQTGKTYRASADVDDLNQKIWVLFGSTPTDKWAEAKKKIAKSDFFGAIQAGWGGLGQMVTHPLRLILYSIYACGLMLMLLITVLMNFLQKAIIIFLDFFVPIALAQFSIQTLRNQAVGFFKVYVGVYCWPFGWIFSNLVTIALLSTLQAPNSNDLGSIVFSIIAVIPVLLWMVIGHVLGPIFAQKVVVHGGAALQGFVGTMFSLVGAGSGNSYGAIAGQAAKGLRGFQGWVTGQSSGTSGQMHQGHQQNSGSSSGFGMLGGAEQMLSGFGGATGANQRSSQNGLMNSLLDFGKGAVGFAAGTGAVMNDAVAYGSQMVGQNLGTIGSLAAESSGTSGGSAYRILSLPGYRTNMPRNDSSQRAAEYLD